MNRRGFLRTAGTAPLLGSGQIREVCAERWGARPGATAAANTAAFRAMSAELPDVVTGGGAVVCLEQGTYDVVSIPRLPRNVRLVGAGIRATVLRRTSNVTLLDVGDHMGLEDLRLDGASLRAPCATIRAGAHRQRIANVEFANCAGRALEIAANAGANLVATGCVFSTIGAVGSDAAIALVGSDSSAVTRHFSACEGAGSTMIDIGGMNNVFVIGGRSEGLLCSRAAGNALLHGLRLGATGRPIVLRGSAVQAVGVNFGDPVVLRDATACSVVGSEVPGNDVSEAGTSATNSIFHRLRDVSVEWHASGSAGPAIGGAPGALLAAIQRSGQQADWQLRLVAGPSTRFGAGTWTFSLPVRPYHAYGNAGGTAWMRDASSGDVHQGVARIDPETSLVEVWIPGSRRKVGAAQPFAWSAGDELNVSLSFTAT